MVDESFSSVQCAVVEGSRSYSRSLSSSKVGPWPCSAGCLSGLIATTVVAASVLICTLSHAASQSHTSTCTDAHGTFGDNSGSLRSRSERERNVKRLTIVRRLLLIGLRLLFLERLRVQQLGGIHLRDPLTFFLAQASITDSTSNHARL